MHVYVKFEVWAYYVLYIYYIGIPNTILLRYPSITIRLTQNISLNDSISENSGSSLYNKIHIETEIEKYTIYTGTIIYTYHPGCSNSYLHYSHLTNRPSVFHMLFYYLVNYHSLMKIIFNLQWAEYNINTFFKCGLSALYGKLWMVCSGGYPSKYGLCDLIWQVDIFNLINLNFSLCTKCSQNPSQLIPFIIICVKNFNCQKKQCILYYIILISTYVLMQYLPFLP